MRPFLFVLLACALGPLLAGCVAREVVYVRAPPGRVVVRRHHVWVPARWEHRRGGRVWTGGYWHAV